MIRKSIKSMFFITMVLCILAQDVIVVNALEEQPNSSLAELGKDFYTLSQLFEMSDDEFLALKGRDGTGEVYYNEIKEDAERENRIFDIVRYGGISGRVSGKSDFYIKNETETIIESALDNTVKYRIKAPSSEKKENTIGTDGLSIIFSDYELSAEYVDITHNKIMEFAKCYFCMDQLFDVNYVRYGLSGNASQPHTETIIKYKATLLGDIDLNGIVELADITTLVKYNLSNEAYPLANETAFANADMNSDGVVDGLDTSALIEDQLGKK